MVLTITHKEGDLGFVDVIREVAPARRGGSFSPEAVVAEFADVCKRYGITRVTGDKYALQWVGELFRRYGIIYDATAKPKSDLYRDLLPLINAGRVRLLDNKRLVHQLLGLERTITKSGNDTIGHAKTPGAHDDVANAVAGALLLAMAKQPQVVYGLMGGGAILHDGTRLSERQLRDGADHSRIRWLTIDELGNELRTDEEIASARQPKRLI